MKKINLFLFFCLITCFNLQAQLNIIPTGPVSIYDCQSVTLSTDAFNANFLPTLADDMHSGAINIGFPFSFYGASYNQLVISSNGYVSFDLGKANTFSEWEIIDWGVPAGKRKIPNNNAASQSVCGLYTDIFLSDGGTIKYGTAGVAPNRKFVVDYCHCRMYRAGFCATQWASFQIILYEGSNNIEVHIYHRERCGAWNNGYGMVGIENNTGTGDWPPGRNATPLWNVNAYPIGTNWEAHRFTPSGGGYSYASIPYAPIPDNSTIAWYIGSTLVGSGSSITVSPSSTTTYTAKASGCEGYQAAPASKLVTVLPAPPLSAIVGDNTICDNETKLYTDATPGGTWSISPSTFATVSASGYVTGHAAGTATITYTVTLPCPGAVYKIINVNPSPVFTPICTPNPLCVGQTYTLSVTGVTFCPGCSYSWSSIGGVISTSPTVIRPPITDPLGAGVPYDITLTNSFGCSTNMFFPVHAEPNPNASFTLPTPLCGGDVITATVPLGGTLAGTWSCMPGWPTASVIGGVLTCGPVTSPTVVTITHTVTTTNCGTDIKSQTVTINPSPIFTPTVSPGPYCSGVPFTLSALITSGCAGGCSYLWNLGSGGTSTSPIVTHTEYELWGMSYIYTLKLTNSYGCSATNSLIVDVNPEPHAGHIVGPTSGCDGVSYGFGIVDNNGLGLWSLTGGGGLLTIDPDGHLILTGTVLSPTTVTISYTVGAGWLCGPLSVATHTFTLYPLPSIAPFVSPIPVCSGDPYFLHSGVSTACSTCFYTYHWSSMGGPVITTTSDPLPRPPVFDDWGISIPYTLMVENQWGCQSNAQLVVDVHPKPKAGHIVGPTSGCDGVSYGFGIVDNNGLGVWSLTGGGGLLTIDPDGHLILTGTVLSPTTVTISYTVGAGWLCGPLSVATHTFTLYPLPSIAPFVSPIPVCSGDPYFLHSGVSTACSTCFYTYHWSSMGGPVVTTTSDPLPRPPVFDDWGISIPYTLMVENQWGCQSNAQLVVDVHPKPKAGTIKGPESGCNDVSYGFTIEGNNGGGTWGVIGSPSLTMDAAGHLIVLGPITVPTTVTITYTVGGAGWLCGPVSVATHTFTLFPVPVIAPFVVPNPACSGLPYSLHAGVSSGCGTCTYTWTGPGGTTTMTDPLVMPPVFDPGGISIPYTVTVTNSGGCSATGNLVVDVMPPAEACAMVNYDPILLEYYFTITGTFGATVSYEFYDCFGGLLGSGSGMLVGSTVYGSGSGITYPAGTCQMCVTSVSNLGCTWPTFCCARLNIGEGGKPGTSDNESNLMSKPLTGLTIVPNPNKGVFTISGDLASASIAEAQIEITDVLGKVIYSDVTPVEKGRISKKVVIADNVANGVYLLKVRNDGSGQVIRFTLDR